MSKGALDVLTSHSHEPATALTLLAAASLL
jgi:hypothetical protein